MYSYKDSTNHESNMVSGFKGNEITSFQRCMTITPHVQKRPVLKMPHFSSAAVNGTSEGRQASVSHK